MLRLWVIGAVVLALWTAAAQATAHAIINEAFSVEDVRRPIYRGNIRYNFTFPHNLVKNIFGNEEVRSTNFLNKFHRDYDIYYSSSNKNFANKKYAGNIGDLFNYFSTSQKLSTMELKNSKKMDVDQSSEKDDSDQKWSLVEIRPDVNQSKIVQRLFEASLNDLAESSESLDKLIIAHTESSDKKIQMIPEGSPPSWVESPLKPNVILIEDVHPSKLPKPEYAQIPLYQRPTRPSILHNNYIPTKPSWSYQNPTTSKPTEFSDYQTPSNPQVPKPFHYYGSSTTSNYGDLLTTKPPSNYGPTTPTKPPEHFEHVPSPSIYLEISHTLKPLNNHGLSATKPSYNHGSSITPSHLYGSGTTKLSYNYESFTTTRPTNSLWSTTTKPSNHYNSGQIKPTVQYEFPRPITSKPVYHNPDLLISNKPAYINYKPLTVKPPYGISSEPSLRPVLTSTHLPKPIIVTEVVTQYTPIYVKPPPEPPPSRPPPPTIVVIESPSDNHIDCGTVQVINSASFKDCPDVTVVLNAENNSSIAPPETHAAAAPAASTSLGLNSIAAVVPLPPPPLPPPVPVPPSPVVPEAEDDEYDYDDEIAEVISSTTTTTAAPMRPQRPTSILSYILTSLPFLGPISVSLWIILLGPLSFIAIGIMGVASFLVPWLAPGLVFGRVRRSYNQKPQIPYSALTFEKNYYSGLFS